MPSQPFALPVRRRWPVAALLLMLTANAVSAADWFTYRGDQLRSGRAADADYAGSWPEGGPPLVWRREGLGRSRSSPVVSDGLVYLAADKKLLALDAQTGAERWTAATRIKQSTPTVRDGRIVILDNTTCTALSAADGRPLWRTKLDELVEGLDEWGIKYDDWCQSPLVVEGKVIIAVGHPDTPAIALSLADGSLVWRATPTVERQARWRCYTSSLFVERGGTALVIAHFGIAIAGIDAADGRVLWERTINREEQFHRGRKLALGNPSMLFGDLLLSVSSAHYGGPNQQSAFRLAADGTDLEPAWHNPVIRPHQEAALLLDGRLYGTGTVSWTEVLRQEDPVLLNGQTWSQLRETIEVEEPKKKRSDRPFPMPGSGRKKRGIVCQDAATGRVLGIRYGLDTNSWGGSFVGHILVAAGDRIIAVGASQMERALLLQPGPAMEPVGSLAFPPGVHRKGKPDKSDDDRWSTPAIADGLGFFRLNDLLLVYDLRAP